MLEQELNNFKKLQELANSKTIQINATIPGFRMVLRKFLEEVGMNPKGGDLQGLAYTDVEGVFYMTDIALGLPSRQKMPWTEQMPIFLELVDRLCRRCAEENTETSSLCAYLAEKGDGSVKRKPTACI